MSFKDLRIWQQGLELSIQINTLTKDFPEAEKFHLASQMNRCSISIPSNIAEGQGRRSDKEFSRFLNISQGSLNELETQIYISHRLGYISGVVKDSLVEELDSLSKQFTVFRQKLSRYKPNATN